MSSDAIKEALVNSYPETSEKDWKRRTKLKEGTLTKREFEHPTLGRIATYEDPNGHVTVGSAPVISPAGTPPKQIMASQAVAIHTPTPVPTNIIIQTPAKKAVKVPVKKVEPVATVEGEPSEGDRFRFEAGALVFELTYYGPNERYRWSDESGYIANRAGNVTCTGVFETDNWLGFVTEDIENRMRDIMVQTTGSHNIVYLLGWMADGRDPKFKHPDLVTAVAEAKAEMDKLYNGVYRFAVWGKGDKAKCVHISEATKLAEVVKESVAPKEQKINKRRQMVKGSTWRFDKDVELTLMIANPQRTALYDQARNMERSRNVQRRVGNTVVIAVGAGQGNTSVEEVQMRSLRAQADALPKMVKVKAGHVSAGTVISIVDKPQQSNFWGDTKESNGLMVPIEVVSGKFIQTGGYLKDWRGWLSMPYKAIEPAITALDIPEAIVYVLRDKKTGEFFGGWESEFNGNYNQSTDTPKMSKTFSGSKKYKNSAAAKASIREFTGYNEGLDDAGPYWATGGSKKMDLPKTWEMVAIDKTTNAEKETIEIQKWFKNLMRLRVLTVNFGGALRAVYKKAEGRTDIEAIVTVANVDEDGRIIVFNDHRDDDATIAYINEQVKDLEIILKHKANNSFAFACSHTDAMLLSISVAHPHLKITAVDFNNLEELVK